jgi:hypothetical protein
MTSNHPTRRRLLSYLAALGGVGALGAWSWLVRRQPADPIAAATDPVELTTLPPVTTTAPSTTVASTTSTPATTTTTTSTTTATSTTTTTTPTVEKEMLVVCPEAWGALPVAGEFKTHTIERLTVHHTAVALGDNRNAPARARQHQRYHQELGWSDLAYHYLVDANGNIYEGRPVDAVGDTATEYDPTGHFLVCCEGDFNQETITDAQLESLIDMLAWAAEEYGVSPSTISGHREWAKTTCPGDDLQGYVASGFLQQQAEARISAGGVTLTRLCGDVASTLVEDIEAGRA